MPAPDPTTNPLRVAVLYGGDSEEREISLESGEAVIEALRSRGHEVLPVDPLHQPLEKFSWTDVDVAFIALHGRFGEDGQVQQILETAQIPYTGSSAESSRLAFSKSAAKERMLLRDIPTPNYALIHSGDERARITAMASQIGYPLVAKPDQQGSSLGVRFVHEPGQLMSAIEDVFEFGTFCVLESVIAGEEWTVGVLDSLLLPPIRIEVPEGFYDFDSKYKDERTEYHVESGPLGTVAARVSHVGARAAAALGTAGLARIDVRVDGAGQPWVLEVNTVPGMTSHSLVPKSAAAIGWDFPELCDRTLRNALQRWHYLQTPRNSGSPRDSGVSRAAS
ncbi:D-alanine--D-alanine ligase Ddl [Maioricimonas rarisocia]|uniref:D-alanine--D-alanine ligase n=1 Tax=Maioricimonas rarisocia TaxID=2528026 RepID=A0A517Z6S8_9PLAN|nr:D-alanine--D-alanine ligase [Maioricimonas rarisocia]QDU38192.1 D-alanine--D-alanine ligase Ddl [Maioricimonas rarisocia]